MRGVDGRRISVTKRSGAEVATVAFAADARGTLDRGTAAAGAGLRLEALSVPDGVGSGREWTPFTGAVYSETGKGAVIDNARTFRVVGVTETDRGIVYRSVFNLRPHVIRSGYVDGHWPFESNVLAIGVTEAFIPRGQTSSVLVASAEYHLLGSERPASLAVGSIAELRARIAEQPTFFTLTCLRDGNATAIEAARQRPEADRGLGLEQCETNH